MKYELALVFKPLSSEDIKDKVMPKIEKTIKDLDGKMALKNSLGKRLLAYPINKFKEGIYSFYNIEISSAKTAELKKDLRLTNEVLRFLLIRSDQL